ncbi:MAG: DNA helicase UvrD [Acidimicrobiales bacterium]|nr:MAG: DNA helicase UvrD [Acidimicrobiales bacterium]
MVSYSAVEVARMLELPAPTAQQAAIISAPLQPLLVVAGAGSGKTETMAARVIWLVANGLVRPEEVLGLTFTRKAAGELAGRLSRRLTQLAARGLLEQTGDPVVSTYHAYALRIVAEHGIRAGYEPQVQLLGEAASWQLVDAVVRGYDGDMSSVSAAPSTVTTQVRDLAAQLAEQLRSPEELAAFSSALCARIQRLPVGSRPGRGSGTVPKLVADLLARQRYQLQLLPLISEYAARKQKAEAADYGDQVARAARLARDHPDVGGGERARFRVVLLDEYQDTSYAQLQLLTALFGAGHPVIAVGDSCQAIYSWRGASPGNLTRFPTDFPREDGAAAEVAPLSTSWRNPPAVLTVANELSRPLRTGQMPDLTPAPQHHGSGEVRYALCDSVADEAAWLAAQLADIWRDGGETPPTAAVLLRTRAQISRYADALTARGIPVEVVGVGGLLETAEVCDVIATLRVLVDPTAGSALLRLLTGARWRIGPRDLAALASRAHSLTVADASLETHLAVDEPSSIVDALEDLGSQTAYSSEGYLRLQMLRDELRELRKQLSAPLPELINAIETAMGIGIEVAVREPSSPTVARVHLDQLATVISDFANTATLATPSALLAYLDAAADHERGLAPGSVAVHSGAVQLLTVHAAKGLEWDVVAVPEIANSAFPSKERSCGLWTKNAGVLPFELRGDSTELPSMQHASVQDQVGLAAELADVEDRWKQHYLAEERRLVYVAVTRARRTLLCSAHWWAQGAKKPRGPSLFLNEIAESAKRLGIEPDVWVQPPAPDAGNPLAAQSPTAAWPADPLGPRRPDIEAGAALVVAADPARLNAAERSAGEDWFARAQLLLAERTRIAQPNGAPVLLPDSISVSELVGLNRDPAQFVAQLRRPMPRPPAPMARRGTSFHAWLERRFAVDRLLDIDELPGAADLDSGPDDDLPELQRAFEASEWARRSPMRVEVPFSMTLGGVVLRGRMDAVFATPADALSNGGNATRSGSPRWDVIDWKTGAVPTGQAARHVAVQLAVYRLAWARLAGVALAEVQAGFHYVRANHTQRPVNLLDEAELTRLITSLPLE